MTKTTILILISILVLFGIGCYIALKPNTPNSMSLNNNGMMSNINGKMNGVSMMVGMTSMPEMVKDDQSFIEAMIPHHQEAVDSSNQILISTQDPELKTFVQNVISAQTKEINEMKTWYKQWYGKDYTDSSNYQAMMGGMNNKTGSELDQEYIKGMIQHHAGAIQMAKKIQTITKRAEVTKLASDIIISQTREQATLMGWMMSK